MTFDNNNFSLASKLPGPLDPGKVTNFQIKYDGKADLPSTGRMIVTSKATQAELSPVNFGEL